MKDSQNVILTLNSIAFMFYADQTSLTDVLAYDSLLSAEVKVCACRMTELA